MDIDKKQRKHDLQKKLDDLCKEIKESGFDLYVHSQDICLGSVEHPLHPREDFIVIGKQMTEEELEEIF